MLRFNEEVINIRFMMGRQLSWLSHSEVLVDTERFGIFLPQVLLSGLIGDVFCRNYKCLLRLQSREAIIQLGSFDT